MRCPPGDTEHALCRLKSAPCLAKSTCLNLLESPFQREIQEFEAKLVPHEVTYRRGTPNAEGPGIPGPSVYPPSAAVYSQMPYHSQSHDCMSSISAVCVAMMFSQSSRSAS